MKPGPKKKLGRRGTLCPICGCQTEVTDSRAIVGGVRRRRACVGFPSHRFTTFEMMIEASRAQPVISSMDMARVRIVMEQAIRRATESPVMLAEGVKP